MTDAPDVAPAADATLESSPPVVALPSPGLGRVALTAAIVLITLSVILSVLLGVIGSPYVDRTAGGANFYFGVDDPNPVIAMLAIAAILHPLVGTGVGLWVIVQSIVAITANRGRTQAIVALVIAVVAPVVSLVVYLGIMLSPR